VVESDRLESGYPGMTGIAGSNPALSSMNLFVIFKRRAVVVESLVNPAVEQGQNLDQLCAVVPKLWGREEWIVNNQKYCGKKLIFNKGYRFSLHYHKIKEESFYILHGLVYLELVTNGVRTERIMTNGDIAHIAPYVQHRITALSEAEIMEFSTHHMEDDSYRLEDSCKIDLASLVLPR
jgi:quercetin dioxygenase-like cupin family protein